VSTPCGPFPLSLRIVHRQNVTSSHLYMRKHRKHGNTCLAGNVEHTDTATAILHSTSSRPWEWTDGVACLLGSLLPPLNLLEPSISTGRDATTPPPPPSPTLLNQPQHHVVGLVVYTCVPCIPTQLGEYRHAQKLLCHPPTHVLKLCSAGSSQGPQ
jgi:hypothetical protein